MNHVEVKSSNIKSIGYDSKTQIMEVRFLSGALYRFEKVPALLHKELMEARSKGQYFARNIRNNPQFPCILVKEDKFPESDEETVDSISAHIANILEDSTMTKENRLIRIYDELGQFLESIRERR